MPPSTATLLTRSVVIASPCRRSMQSKTDGNTTRFVDTPPRTHPTNTKPSCCRTAHKSAKRWRKCWRRSGHDPRASGTVEAEAIPANVTRRLVREAIEQHLDLREVEVMQTAEASEAEWLEGLARVLEEAA